MQALLTTKADELARSCGFVRRQRKVTGANFAQAVVFTAMADAEATESRLHSTAAAVGLDASRQALEKRFNAKGAAFLRALLRTAVAEMVASPVAVPLLQRFTSVEVLDSSIIALPDELAEIYHDDRRDGRREDDRRPGPEVRDTPRARVGPRSAGRPQRGLGRGRPAPGRAATGRPELLLPDQVRPLAGGRGVLAVAAQERHQGDRRARPPDRFGGLPPGRRRRRRRHRRPAGQRVAVGLPADRAAGPRRGGGPAPETALGQERAPGRPPQRLELGPVRLDDPGDERAAGVAERRGGRGVGPDAVADRANLQAVEEPRRDRPMARQQAPLGLVRDVRQAAGAGGAPLGDRGRGVVAAGSEPDQSRRDRGHVGDELGDRDAVRAPAARGLESCAADDGDRRPDGQAERSSQRTRCDPLSRSIRLCHLNFGIDLVRRKGMKTIRIPHASSTPLPELAEFLAPFHVHFQRSEGPQALERYLTGLLTEHPNKNCDTLAQVVPGTPEQRLQGLLTALAWDEDDLNRPRVERLLALPTEGD